jgi:transcriptional regulator with XRE-family HTH domain
MTPASLTAWMARLRLNKSEAASALGIARSTLDRYLSGETAIPPVVALACAAIAHGVPPIK